MRWKIICVTSLAAAVAGFGIWFGLILVTFGSAAELPRNPISFTVSMAIPLASCIYAGVFAYRHTAKQRKLQATLTAILALILTAAVYFLASQVSPSKLVIPRTFEMRHSR